MSLTIKFLVTNCNFKIGLVGHKFREHGHEDHHYGRDAALGAGFLEHEHHKHENKHANDPTAPSGVAPSVGDKIKGNVEKVIGKVTGNEAKVVQGDLLAHGNTRAL